jgi:UPF0271 protein
MARIDINCDLGESFGAWTMGADDELLPWISSANIACGLHAGDPAVMRRTVGAALARGVAVGAHPGLPDLQGFGRRALEISPEEAYELVLYQAGALLGFALAAGTRLTHVKPHGALYNLASRDAALADAIAQAVRALDSSLVLFGLAGSELVAAGRRAGLATAAEAFADRNYAADGLLVSRRQPAALVRDPAVAAARVLRMVREGKVTALSGEDVALQPETICIHGDGPHAAAMARAVYEALTRAGVSIVAAGARGQPG